jgi:hypothetical protein
VTQSALPIRAQWPLNHPNSVPMNTDKLAAVLKKLYYMYDNPELVRICADALNGRFEEALR